MRASYNISMISRNPRRVLVKYYFTTGEYRPVDDSLPFENENFIMRYGRGWYSDIMEQEFDPDISVEDIISQLNSIFETSYPNSEERIPEQGGAPLALVETNVEEYERTR